ncbi:hypothetical protein CQU01_12860 [Cerasibacillus quisquiliarum]|uniref:DUF3679 domain-containing protein n=2 Tax=Cerasibacillus quisquiliarum TaxID=227865 RepID=A0A511UZ71_9BACI|nr:hypothetical protein CQU01_12860 [Cerasibacillus quisquiliarum]
MMARFTIFVLCFVIFFLIGMLFGLDKQSHHFEENAIYPIKYSESLDINIEKERMHTLNTQKQSPHFTQKLATGLEKIVTGFYEGVVQVIYQISSLLF